MSSRPVSLLFVGLSALGLLGVPAALPGQPGRAVAAPPTPAPAPPVAAPASERPSTPTTLVPGPPPSAAAQDTARLLNEAFVGVFDRAAPSVVVVDVSKEGGVDNENNPMDYFGDFFFRNQPEEDQTQPPAPSQRPRRPRRSQSEGSGFVIRPDGYILTNNHVVEGGSKVEVRFKDGRTLPARKVGADEKTDIAVIKVDARDLPAIEFANSDAVRVGQLCFAIGVPFKQDYTFTQGIVSAKNRNNLQMAAYEDYIQTDASINPGNSGGPLLDLGARVIGMNTLINGLNRGLGFAIPSNMLQEISTQLIQTGRITRPYLGIRIETLTEEAVSKDTAMFAGARKGVVVRTIEPDTPAYRSDLKPADVITEVDGVPVTTDRDLQKQVLGKRVGQPVQLTVVRRGKVLRIPVVTSELPGEVAKNAPPGPEPAPGDKGGANPYGIEVQKVTKELAESMGLESDNGLVVTSVVEDSPAGRAGIKKRDVITDVGDRAVNDVDGFKEALRGADLKRGIDLSISRGNSKTFVVLRAK